MELNKNFEKIYISVESQDAPVTKRLQNHFFPEQIEWVQQQPLAEKNGMLSATEFDRSKRQIYIHPFKGRFFKRCPGAGPGLTCCNYFVLNLGQQCDMNCSYCYLQSFINSPIMSIYSNLDQALSELKTFYPNHKNSPLRVGTGEVIDSLSLDPMTLYSRDLIEFFKDTPRWKLEFKTKSDHVDQFLDLGPAPNVIVSWSINPQFIVASEELGTASLHQRLVAAQKCLTAGFQIALHIDPVIWHPNWEENYSELVDQITSQFNPQDLPYISLGALRFQPEQRHLMRERFSPKSWVVRSEMFTSSDGKLRYDRSLRQNMFNFIISRFKQHNKQWNIFLCMESPETWLKTYEQLPKKVDGLNELFDHSVTKAFTT